MGGRIVIARRGGWCIYADKRKPHVLLVGPSGSGKTESGIIPNLLLWGDNPLVCASSKEDLLDPTWRVRKRYGPVWVLDLRMGIFGLPEGAHQANWSPLHGLDNPVTGWERAISIGRAMQGVTNSDAYWTERGTSLLAPLLWAAANAEPALRISAVKGWVQGKNFRQAADILRWAEGRRKYGADKALRQIGEFESTIGAGGAHADSIISSGSNALAWLNGRIEDRANLGDFAPESILDEGGSLYIISPPISQNDWGGAPAVVGVLDQIRSAARDRVGHKEKRVDCLWALDEVASIAPIDLTAYLRELRGYGIRLLVATQSWGDIKSRWGEHQADSILTNSGYKVIWGGGDPKLLAELEGMSHTHWVAVEPGATSKRRAPVWTVEKLVHLPFRQVVVFSPPTKARGYRSAWYQRLWAVELLHTATVFSLLFGGLRRRDKEAEAWLLTKQRKRLVALAVTLVLIVAVLIKLASLHLR